jgi:hypothetical protein
VNSRAGALAETSSGSGMAAIPWKLALLSVVGSERLLQALQDLEEILYHPHGVSA